MAPVYTTVLLALSTCLPLLSLAAPSTTGSTCPTNKNFRLRAEPVGTYLAPGVQCNKRCGSFFDSTSPGKFLYNVSSAGVLQIARGQGPMSKYAGYVAAANVDFETGPQGEGIVDFGPNITPLLSCAIVPAPDGAGCDLSCYGTNGVNHTTGFSVYHPGSNQFYVGNHEGAGDKAVTVKVIYAV